MDGEKLNCAIEIMQELFGNIGDYASFDPWMALGDCKYTWAQPEYDLIVWYSKQEYSPAIFREFMNNVRTVMENKINSIEALYGS